MRVRWARRERGASLRVAPARALVATGLPLVVVFLLSAPAIQIPAAAQQVQDGADVRLFVSSLTGVLGPGSVGLPDEAEPGPRALMDATTLGLRVLIDNQSDADVQALRLVTEIHPAATSRRELREAMAGTITTDPLTIRDPAIRDGHPLRSGETTGVEQSFRRPEVDWAEGGGVHPVRIAVTRGTRVLDEVVTAVIWVEEAPENPIMSVMVWPLDTTPWRIAGGEFGIGSGGEIHTGERLDDLIRSLEQAPTAPVVLAPAPHLLEDLADQSDGFTIRERLDGGNVEPRQITAEDAEAQRARSTLQRIRSVVRSMPYAPAVGSYAGADLSALLAAGNPAIRELAGQAASTSRQRLQRQLERAPDGGVHLLDGPVTPPVLDLFPGDQLLVPYDAVADPDAADDTGLSDPLRSLRSPAGRALTAVVADPHLSELLSRPDESSGPVVAAQRILTETAMAYFATADARGRTLLLLPEPDWDPGFAVSSMVLDGLTSAAWIDLVSPSQALAEGRRSAESLPFSAPPEGDFPPAFLTQLDAALTELGAARGALVEDETLVGGRSPTDLEDSLMRASSTWLRSEDQSAAESLVRDVRQAADTVFGDVEISDSSVTLTSDRGQVPVTLQRPRGGPIVVQVEVASQGRLVWPEGRRSARITLPEDGSATVSFAMEALSTGTFPVTVRVTDPSGGFELERATVTVRSTAISGPALAGIGSLVVVLLLIGGLRRRHRPPNLEVVSAQDGRASTSEPRYSRPGE